MAASGRASERGFSLIELMMAVSVAGVLATLGTHSMRGHMSASKSVEAVSMLGSMRSAAVSAAHEMEDADLEVGRSLAFGRAVRGKNGGGPKNDIDGDGDHGHGNNDGKCDPSNPGSSKNCDGGDTGGGSSDGGGSDGGSADGGGSDASDSGSDDLGGAGPGGSFGNLRLCGSAQPVPASMESVRGKRYQSSPAAWHSGDWDSGWTCLRMTRSEPQHYQYGYDLGSSKVSGGDGASGAAFTAWARGDLDGDGRTSWFTLEGGIVDGQVVTAPSVNVIDPHE